jgi:hypothetical protein
MKFSQEKFSTEKKRSAKITAHVTYDNYDILLIVYYT